MTDVDKKSLLRWPAVLVIIAVACFVASFFVVSNSASAVSKKTTAIVSVSPGRQGVVRMPGPGAPSNGSIRIHFSFNDDHLVNGQLLFNAGGPTNGARATMTGPIDGNWYVILELSPWTGGALRSVLVSHVKSGKTYDVTVTVQNQQRVTAWLNGRQQFVYSSSQPVVSTLFREVIIGTSIPPVVPGEGLSIFGFDISSLTYLPSGSLKAEVLLRLLGGLVAVLVAVMILMGLALRWTLSTSSLNQTDGSGVPTERRRQHRRSLGPKILSRYPLLIGIGLLIFGGLLLEVATPPQNTIVEKSGTQSIKVGYVLSNESTTFYLAGEPNVFRDAAALDVNIAFELRVSSSRLLTDDATVVVSTAQGPTGISFLVLPGRALVGELAIPDAGGVAAPVLSSRLPTDRWIHVHVTVERSRHFEFYVDGHDDYSYTYYKPALAAAPSDLKVGSAGSGIAVRQLSLNVQLYSSSASASTVFFVRLGQILGFVLAALGVALIAQRLLWRLIPPSAGVKRSLVLITFGITGTGTILNFAFDALHTAANASFVARNSWLYIPDIRFSDFTLDYEIVHSLNPYGILTGSYPPLGFLLVLPFTILREYAALFLFMALFVGFFVWWILRSFGTGFGRVGKLGLVLVALTSLPVTWGLDRANFDLIVFAMLVFGIAALEQRRDTLAASWLALVLSIKIYPVLYLIEFVRIRKWRWIAISLLGALVASLFAFLAFHGTLFSNIDGLRKGISALEATYTNGISSANYNTSIAGYLQAIGYVIGGPGGAHGVRVIISPLVLPEEIVGTLALAWYLRFREDELWRSITVVTIAVLLLPDVSYYYDLIYLFIPLALFVQNAHQSKQTLRVAVLFGLLLTPKTYFFFGASGIDSSVLLTAPLLVALMVSVIVQGSSERREAGRLSLREPAEVSTYV